MFVVGLTGGIGSGKSVVAQLFAQLGVSIIDADIIAKRVTEPHQQAFAKIVSHFGSQIISSDGTLNRALLRSRIFKTKSDRLWLEKLLHPLIIQEMKDVIAKLAETKPSLPYCLAVIPLLFESDLIAFFDRILVVDANEQTQVNRVSTRDKLPLDEILAILDSQAKRHERIARAHDIIHNDGLITDLDPQVKKLHDLYTNLALKKKALSKEK